MEAEAVPDSDRDGVAMIIEDLRRSTGIDFSDYKDGTITRQINRRMALTGTKDLADYRLRMSADRTEAASLVSALLVSVTSFFRDPSAWSALEERLHQEWSLQPDSQRRIWVPGCSTGEEAYTMAMVAARALGSRARLSDRVKIFATDLREDSLTVARRGVFTDAAVAAIPDELRELWWRPRGESWEVSPGLRDAVVFAQHNVTCDPPFPRLDLISIRNTLIYFRPSLQKRALRMFRYSLMPGGLLFLGRAERVDQDNPFFTEIDGPHRIYARTEADTAEILPFATAVTGVPDMTIRATPDRLRDSVLASLLPASLVVDANDNVIEVVGDVEPWCWVAPGTPSTQLVALLRDDLRVKVRMLLLRIRSGEKSDIAIQAETSENPVTITARLIGADHPGFAVVSFHRPDVPDSQGPATVADSTPADVLSVTRELESTQAALQSTVEDLSASNEELRALNEELQASSEETQSANEELQATNEELTTLNQEIQVRSADLERAKSDLQNIQDSVSAGLILVDRDLRVTRFTQPAVRVFALIEEDVGRDITSIPTTVEIEGLGDALRDAVRNAQQRILNLAGQGSDFILQVRPYLSDDGRVLGAVLILTDVTQISAAQREVATTLAQLRAATDSIDDVVCWQRDAGGKVILVSRGVERVFGLKRDRVLESPDLLLTAVHPLDSQAVALAMSATDSRWDLRYRIVRPDGSVRWVEDHCRPGPSDLGAHFTTGFIRDITERVLTEEMISVQDALRDALFGLHDLGVATLSASGKIILANESLAGLSGYTVDDLLGMPVSALITSLPEAIADLRPGSAQHRLVTKDQRPRLVSVEISTVDTTTDAEVRTLMMVQDVTPSVEVAQGLEQQIKYDTQTGVLARAAFRRRVEVELNNCVQTGSTLAVLWIDIDRFKEVNDTHGHRTGDAVLSTVAKRLADVTRGQDNVGRLGGDEFGILVTDNQGNESIDLVCQRALAAVREPLDDGESTLFVSASVGIAVAPEDGQDADTLLHNADTAMYSVKRHGGDASSYFQQQMNEAAASRGSRRQQLAAAVRSRSFCMHYQPVVDLRTGTPTSVEALIRWLRDGETVSAGAFIEDARATGLIRSIGRIGQALIDEDLRVFETTEALDGIPVGINLAVEELDDRELMQRVMRWSPAGGMRRLLVEVTEQSLLPGTGMAMDTLLVFQRLGAQVCIDDFGTGYSNVAVLSRLKPAVIKMDMSLLMGASENARGRQLLSASIQMAHALEAEVVVEGIETQEQADLASRLGAEQGQGYYFARPMPLSDLATWMQEVKADKGRSDVAESN